VLLAALGCCEHVMTSSGCLYGLLHVYVCWSVELDFVARAGMRAYLRTPTMRKKRVMKVTHTLYLRRWSVNL
jgi:hypothetical protein